MEKEMATLKKRIEREIRKLEIAQDQIEHKIAALNEVMDMIEEIERSEA